MSKGRANICLINILRINILAYLDEPDERISEEESLYDLLSDFSLVPKILTMWEYFLLHNAI